ncbi:MAG: SPW repeat protein [Zoogloea sp.]|nr:SPW repeat protein [Zoogloea sp.]
MWKKRWQDGVTLLAGIWFILAPWALGYGDAPQPVLYNSVLIGLALILFSAGALAKPQTWEEVIDFLIGVWAIISPWALGYTAMRGLMLNSVLIGLVVAVLALWNATERSGAMERWRGRLPG